MFFFNAKGRVQRGKKFGLWKNFSVTKATDLKTIFFEKMKKHVLIVFKNKIFYFFIFISLFLTFFTSLPSTQTIKVIGLILFSISWIWKIGLYTFISNLDLDVVYTACLYSLQYYLVFSLIIHSYFYLTFMIRIYDFQFQFQFWMKLIKSMDTPKHRSQEKL